MRHGSWSQVRAGETLSGIASAKPRLEQLVPVDSSVGLARKLDALDAKGPGMRNALTDDRPAIRRHFSVFVNGRRETLSGALASGEMVEILTAVSGG